MGQKKQTPCQRCSAPAYGSVCKHCSLADLRSRKRAKAANTFVNSVGEFNASGGGYNTGIAIPKVAPTVGPWWIGLSREQLQAQAHQHADRMSRGAAGNFRTLAEGINS